MQNIIEGKAFVFGANIDTDQIYPGRFLDISDPNEVGKHAMKGADPEFIKNFKKGDIVVAATNFGCGSSREHAVITLKSAGVGAIIADSYGRIFYRNAINLGIPVIVCKDICTRVRAGDELRVDVSSGNIMNITSGEKMIAEPFSEYTMSILSNGGIKSLIKKELEA